MLEVLNRNAGRINALVEAAAREQSNLVAAGLDQRRIERREIELWPLVEGLIFDLQPVNHPSVEIVNSVPNDFVVFADALLLTQVFQNLLSNAIRYTTDGKIVVGAENLESRVRCWVSDTGSGIPAERLAKIFDKLETDPDNKGGLGLGLAIVKQIVERHGGQIFVESRVDEGSTFSFTLPPQREISAG
jgi:signal transduction histidine kinase